LSIIKDDNGSKFYTLFREVIKHNNRSNDSIYIYINIYINKVSPLEYVKI